MALYLVRNPKGLPIWLAYVDDEVRVWSYVHNTGMFHLNHGLFLDFTIEQENTYELVDVMTAETTIRAGLGTLSHRTHAFLIRRFQADPAARPAADILAHAVIDEQESL